MDAYFLADFRVAARLEYRRIRGEWVVYLPEAQIATGVGMLGDDVERLAMENKGVVLGTLPIAPRTASRCCRQAWRYRLRGRRCPRG